MDRLHRFVLVLISVIAVSPCFAQSSPELATGQTPTLIASNYLPTTGTAPAVSTDLDPSQATQQASALPDAPSPMQARFNFEPAQSDFAAPDCEETPTSQRAGKLARMISGIIRRFDVADVATPPGIRESAGFSGDTSFAVSQRLALIGGYEHNSVPSFDTMALGVAYTFGRNAN
jgi:hypothetical protein